MRRARRGENTISSDYLYLKNPQTGVYHGFRFNIDFFATAGDGTWWHDHRFPGGIAFTANAAGHMKCFMDWYTEPGRDHGAWALTQAMMTIAKAHPTNGTKEGAAPTELTAQEEGRERGCSIRSMASRSSSDLPARSPRSPSSSQGRIGRSTKGCSTPTTRCAMSSPMAAEPITKHKRPLLDFTYLYDDTQAEFTEFMAGRVFGEDEVFADIGPPESWSHREGDQVKIERTEEQTVEIAVLLDRCVKWEEILG